MNKRSVIRILTVLAFSVGLLSCGKESREMSCLPQEDVLLTVSLDIPAIKTKSGFEDTVSSLSVYVYRRGQENSDAVFVAHGITPVGMFAKTYIPGTLLETIRNVDSGNATVLVIANASLSDGASTSLSSVLSSKYTSSFDSESSPSSLPMYGQCTASLSADGRVLSGTVTLRRSVSKLEVRIIELASNIIDGVEVFVPDTEHMQLSIQNGLKTGVIGGVENFTSSLSSERYSRTVGPLSRVDDENDDFLYYHATSPFFSYSTDWSSDDGGAVSFVLVVPWSQDGGTSWRQSYYQIPVNPYGLCLEENTHYILNMKIGIVGSFEEEAPVVLEPSVVIQPWGEVEMVEENIVESRYLVVGTTHAILNNEEQTTIQFASSHNCIISSKQLTRKILSSVSESTETISESEYTLTLNNSTGVISFYHELDNSGAASADFAPYELTFVVAHESRPSYSREVRITQHPMISVVAQENTDGSSSTNKGYTYVNNGTNLSYYGNGCNGLTGSNKNPNMYIISISALSDDSTYTIGDPRTSFVNNLPVGVQGSNTSTTYTYNASWSASATSLSGGSRRLSYYHPAETGDRTENMIAPKFRVASSYGACNAHKFTNMERRCAAYQEDGYPAGRWRLPTAAEIFYITSLSAQGTIPELFTIGVNDSDGYWCANGWVGGDSSGNPTLHKDVYTGNNYVRCVYDEWFWGSEQLSSLSTFTWGDVNY